MNNATTAAQASKNLYYLVKLHSTKTTTYYAAYQHTENGLSIVWPTDSSDHKASKALGFHYAQPSSAIDVAYTIKVSGYAAMAELNAKAALTGVLRRMGRSIEELEVCALKGAFAWAIN